MYRDFVEERLSRRNDKNDHRKLRPETHFLRLQPFRRSKNRTITFRVLFIILSSHNSELQLS